MTENHKILFKRAIEYGKNRNYVKSSECLLQIISQTDKYPEAFLYLGRSCHALKDFEKAVQCFKFYISYNPDSAKGYFFKGRSYLALGMPLRALYCFKKASELSDNNSEIFSLTGIAYFKLKKVSLAAYYLEKAVLADPENKSVYNAYLNILHIKGIRHFYSGDSEAAAQIFSFLINAGFPAASILLYLAYIKKEQGDYQESINLYEKVITENPDDYLLKIQIIPLLVKAGQNQRALEFITELTEKNISLDSDLLKDLNIDRILAIETFKKLNFRESIFHGKKVVKKNYYDNDIHLLLGESYRNSQIYDKAENHFRLVINRDESSIEACYGLFMVLWSHNRFEDLYKELLKAKKRFSHDEIIHYYLVLTRCRLSESPAELIPLIHEEIKKNLTDSYLFDALAEQYFKINRADLAENWYKKALSLNANLKSSYTGLIKTFHVLDKKASIGTVFMNYLKQYPDNSKIRKYYIHHLYLTGKYSKAVKEIDKYIYINKNESEMIRLQAKCFLNLSNFDRALILYRHLLREYPENVNYLISYAYCLDRLSRTGEAAELLEESLYFFRSDNTVLLTTGVLQFKKGNYEKAVKYFRKAMGNNDKDWRAYYNLSRVYDKQGLKDLAQKFRKHSEYYKKNA